MSTDEPGSSSHFKDIKARFESGLNAHPLNNHHPESTVAKTKRLFEKTKNPINASNRFKPALKPKPKYLSQQRIDPQPPPVPKHGSFNRSIVSPVLKNKFNFSDSSYTTTTTSDGSSLCPSSSSTLSSSENLRDSHMSEDVPSTPTATDTPADSSSSEDSSPEMEEDDFYVHERRTSMNGESSKAETLHTSIINQMKKDGLFKQLEAIKEHQSGNEMDENEHDSDIENANQNESADPGENGVVMREAPAVPPHQAFDKYPNVSENEKERLIMMERLAAEIGMKEEYFVKILTLMIRKYPEYLKTCTLKGSKYGTQFNAVLNEIKQELEPVLKIHEKLLKEFARLCLTWDSRTPNLASVMFKHVDFLKLCGTFLTKKQKLCNEFKLATDADSEFAHATHQFEVQVMNHADVHNDSQFDHMAYKPIENSVRNSGVCFYQQLDMIHQNVVRYKLFMERYNKLLDPLDPASDDEIDLTRRVLLKLDKILESIDSKLDEPKGNAFLIKIYEKFEAINFNVLMPGRNFIKEGIVLRQTRRDLIERQLILLSDTFFICHLDYSQIWKIDLRKMEIEVEDGAEREKWFILYSTKKSTAIMCASKNERDSWVNKILHAQNQLRSMQRIVEPIEEKSEPAAFSALWVADDEATMCMMEDCARRFHLINRRHHCRKCGYVICKSCSAFALLLNGDSESSRVCPVCFEELFELLHNGKMPHNIADVNAKRIRFTNGKEKLIKELFKPSPSGKKIRGNDYSNKDKYLAAGTIYTKSGSKYARLTVDFDFFIYGARYDPRPAEQFYVQGYTYIATEDPKDGRVHFRLSQQTGRKNNVIEFDVDEKFESLWSIAFNRLK